MCLGFQNIHFKTSSIMCLAVPAKIISLNANADELLRTGNVDFSGVQKEIELF